MNSRTIKNIINSALLLGLSYMLAGAEGCEQSETRSLRRRVQVGKISAPTMYLPQNQGQFDFQFVANAQIYDILRRTQSFSTSTVDPNKTYDPKGLSEDEAASFNQCGDSEQASFVGKGLSAKSIISEKAACLIDLPQGLITGSILNFQLTNSAGASISLTDFAVLPSLSFDFKSYEMSMTMQVVDPMIRSHYIATTSKESYQTELNASATLNLGGFALGPRYYYNSPLRKVVDDGITQSINDLKTQWDKALPWYGMVLRNCDKQIYINAGNSSDAGLMKGDIVKIHNVRYRWEDQVCASRLMGSTINEEPVAYARVTSVGDTISLATVIDNDPSMPYSTEQLIKPGSRVYMHKMAAPVKKTAANP